MAKDVNSAVRRGEDLGLNDSELAFYDALETNEASVCELGDEVLRKIAIELTTNLRNNLTVDWSVRETRQSPAAADGKADTAEVQIPSGPGGESHRASPPTSGSPLSGMELIGTYAGQLQPNAGGGTPQARLKGILLDSRILCHRRIVELEVDWALKPRILQ
jgi:hypothetical protein